MHSEAFQSIVEFRRSNRKFDPAIEVPEEVMMRSLERTVRPTGAITTFPRAPTVMRSFWPAGSKEEKPGPATKRPWSASALRVSKASKASRVDYIRLTKRLDMCSTLYQEHLRLGFRLEGLDLDKKS